MIPLTDPVSEYSEDFHKHDFYDEDGTHLATIEFDEIEDDRSGTWCEVTVWTHVGHDNPEPDIAFERVNLLTKGGSMASILKRLELLGSVNWVQGFSTAVFRTITNYRTASSEGVWLDPLDSNADDATEPFLLKPFIASSGTTVLYGMQGSAKSMLAVRFSLTVATGKPFDGVKPTRKGPVLYVDFEDTPEPHQYRLFAIAQEMGMTMDEMKGLIYHERVSRDLKSARRRLSRIVRDNGIVLVIIDSVGLALAGDVSGSEQTIKLFKMFSRLNAAVLAIDHMTKENNTKMALGTLKWQESTPIGSQYTTSSARLVWFLNELPQSTDRRKVSNLYNTKANHVAKHKPIGMTVDMDWNKKGLLTEVKFTTTGGMIDAVTAKEMELGKHQQLLVWHFRQQREDGNVIPMRLVDLSRGSGVGSSTVNSIVTSKNASWWEQLPGSKQYIISPDGMEMAMLYASWNTGSEIGANGE
ncbi:MAG: AAA family ATPase [Actinomycetia bacterium]|nr:AAA family ATPase [Actinomycetes bacterium]